jgi:ketosteroid isomerase-like protein
MARGKTILGIVLVSVALTASGGGCQTGGGAANASIDTKSEARALTELDEAWSNTAATKDAAKVGAFYADDAIAYPPNEPAVFGRTAATKVWAAYFAEPSFTISWKTTHAEVAASGDLGYTAGTYQDSYTGADGRIVHEVGKFMCVWKRQADGSWKAYRDFWNSDSK